MLAERRCKVKNWYPDGGDQVEDGLTSNVIFSGPGRFRCTSELGRVVLDLVKNVNLKIKKDS